MKLALLVAGGLVALAAVGALVWYWLATNVEQPDYAVVAEEGPFELRDYPPLVVATAATSGDREAGVRAGFRRLADYIFAKDRAGERVAMTAPVTQTPAVAPDEKIAMTAPVTQTPAKDAAGGWQVRFVMPTRYALADLPSPGSTAVTLERLPARRIATVRFSGSWSDANFAAQADRLRDWVAAQGLRPLGPPTYAYYNDPFTPAFLRRNEVMLEVANAAESPAEQKP